MIVSLSEGCLFVVRLNTKSGWICVRLNPRRFWTLSVSHDLEYFLQQTIIENPVLKCHIIKIPGCTLYAGVMRLRRDTFRVILLVPVQSKLISWHYVLLTPVR